MTPEKSAEALSWAKAALDEVGVPFCLFLGTALGARRDGNFCPGDVDDIDIAIHIDHFVRMPEITAAMEKHGLVAGSTYDGGIGPERSFKRVYKTDVDGEERTKIDIFFLAPRGDKMAWTFYTNPPQTRLSSMRFFTSFAKLPFFGEYYNVPFFIEEYLEENYGKNWHTPIPRDQYVWHRDNQTPQL